MTTTFERFIRQEHAAWDRETRREVVVEDCYRISHRVFEFGSVVIDVGANIGFFSALALERGAGLVIAAEASPTNFSALARNLYPYGSRKQMWNRAVWRSDQPSSYRKLHEFLPDGNTGGTSVLPNKGECEVGTISLDYLIGDHEITLLKLDCEGSEYPILYSSTKLGAVEEIVVETHPVNGTDIPELTLQPEDNVRPGKNNPHDLAEYLKSFGFTCSVEPRKGMGLGWAYIRAKRL